MEARAESTWRDATACTSPARWTTTRCIELYAGALAVVFAPFDEDFGYVTLESFLARKPVITAIDAGGPLEFVEDGVNGAVCEPTAAAIACGDQPVRGRSPAARRPTARRDTSARAW